MPLLKREPDVFPEDLFESGANAPWTVAHVRSRQEKVLARHLQPLGVAYFAPQREKTVRRAGRTLRSYLPLFPGYVFLRATADDRALAWRSGVVVRMIEVLDQGRLFEELSQIRTLQRSGAVLVPHPAIPSGAPVRIVDGPFEGYVGVVLRDRGPERLLVSVSLLRKTIAVEFGRETVAPAPWAIAPPTAAALTA